MRPIGTSGIPGLSVSSVHVSPPSVLFHKPLLPPPAASRVYDLTEYGRELKSVMRELSL